MHTTGGTAGTNRWTREDLFKTGSIEKYHFIVISFQKISKVHSKTFKTGVF